MKTYRLNDRPFGGSMDPRLSPSIADDRLNVKLGPRLPSIRETNDRPLKVGNEGRRGRIGLAPSFLNKKG